MVSWFFDKGHKDNSMEKEQSFQQMVKQYSHARESIWTSFSHHMQKLSQNGS